MIYKKVVKKVKCRYCASEHKNTEELMAHLNIAHTKCAYCRTVFSSFQFDDTFCICETCRKLEEE